MLKVYFILKKDIPVGPYTLKEIKALAVDPNDMVRFGDESWKMASEFPELKSLFEHNNPLSQEEEDKTASQPPPFDKHKFENHFDNKSPEPKREKQKKRSPNYIVLIAATVLIALVITIATNMDSINNSSPVENLESPPPPNPVISFNLSNHSKSFFDFLKPCSEENNNIDTKCDYKNSIVRNYALNLINPENQGEFNLGQVCDIYDKIRGSWIYVNDPQIYNYVAFGSESINNGLRGDCDDYAVLMAALLSSIGGEIRLTYAYNDKDGHAYSEINLGKTNLDEAINYINWRYKNTFTNLHYKTDQEKNNWINVDWFSDPPTPGGEYFKETHGTHFYILQNFCETY